jgi:hypothetical protein
MSFTMERSNGFRQWKKDRDEKIQKLTCIPDTQQK